MISIKRIVLFISVFINISFLIQSSALANCENVEALEKSRMKVGLWVEEQFHFYEDQVNYLREFIEMQDYSLSTLSTNDLLNLDLVHKSKLDLIIIPYDAYPAKGAEALDLFIESGGSLLLLNGNPFQNLLLKNNSKWQSIESLGKEIDEFNRFFNWEYDYEQFRRNTDRLGVFSNRLYAKGKGTDEDPYHLIPYNYYNSYISNSLINLSLDNSVKGLSFMIKSESSLPLSIALEIEEKNGNRWKKIIDISPDWEEKSVHLSSFHPYAQKKEQQGDSFILPKNIKKLSFGLLRNISGGGNHEFKIKNIKFKDGIFPVDVRAKSNIPLFDLVRMQDAYGAHTIFNYKFPNNWPRIYYSASFINDTTIRKAQNNHPILNEIVEYKYGGINEFYPLYKWKGGFESEEYLNRFIPLLETSDNKIVAGISIINSKNNNTLGAIMGIGLRNYKYNNNKNLLFLIKNFIKYVDNGIFILPSKKAPLTTGESFVSHLNLKDSVGYAKRIDNIKLALFRENKKFKDFYISGSDSTFVCEFDKSESLKNYSSYRAILYRDNDTLDVYNLNFNPKETLKKLSDFFCETIDNNDGRLNGKSFVDSRGVRTLLASYEIFNESKYLKSAVKWAKLILSEQREDGGYRMGYGYSQAGEESYVADGGEIAIALLRVYAYSEEDAFKVEVLNSMKKYFEFRESFRVLSKGIGVGYSAYNYGAPKSPPFGEVKALFASNENHYTVSLSLAAAFLYAHVTNDSKLLRETARDANWFIERTNQVFGPQAEGIVYSHKLVKDENIRQQYESYLLEAFVQNTVKAKNIWWTQKEGRYSLDLHNLAYVYNNISQDPNIELELYKAMKSMVSSQSEYSVHKLINRVDLKKKDWIYLCNSSLGIAELVSPGVTFKRL